MAATPLAVLAQFSTPTISNALERLGVDPGIGYTDPEIRCLTPHHRPIVGYALTATCRGTKEPDMSRVVAWDLEYWRYVAQAQRPSIAVVQDLDNRPIGSMWGEVNANRHMAFGCLGAVTNGAFRDIDEVEHLGFSAFAGCTLVSHAYGHWIDHGVPVSVGGLHVKPGDLLHADRHGLLRIPPDIDVVALIQAALAVERAEREVIAYCRSSEPSVDALVDLARRITAD